MSAEPINQKLPDTLLWLADAPLFIDEEQVNRFYDAVVRPEQEKGKTIIQVTKVDASKIGGKLGLEGTVSPSKLLGLIKPIFAFINFQAKIGGEAGVEHTDTDSNSETIELHQITTPQRQLEQLTIHYLFQKPDRLFLVDNPSQQDWRIPKTISLVPRQMVFLNLPSQIEAAELGLPETKIIPTAAEFENGKINTLFDKLEKDNGERPPKYPEKASSLDELRKERKDYWKWFEENFSPTQAMRIIEEAAIENGRIRWIDYRIPVTREGDTLHLHISPRGNYDTGTFAYNFVKRGFKHGLRLVGTLKSEPDMNVLAIYDK